jgi:hypothetical protein
MENSKRGVNGFENIGETSMRTVEKKGSVYMRVFEKHTRI